MQAGVQDALDVIMNDATLVKEFDTRQQREKPRLGMMFSDFDWNKTRMKSPS